MRRRMIKSECDAVAGYAPSRQAAGSEIDFRLDAGVAVHAVAERAGRT